MPDVHRSWCTESKFYQFDLCIQGFDIWLLPFLCIVSNDNSLGIHIREIDTIQSYCKHMTTNLCPSFTEQSLSPVRCVLIPHLHWCAQKLGKTQCTCKGIESEISSWQKTNPLFSILGSLFMDSSDCQLTHSLTATLPIFIS